MDFIVKPIALFELAVWQLMVSVYNASPRALQDSSLMTTGDLFDDAGNCPEAKLVWVIAKSRPGVAAFIVHEKKETAIRTSSVHSFCPRRI